MTKARLREQIKQLQKFSSSENPKIVGDRIWVVHFCNVDCSQPFGQKIPFLVPHSFSIAVVFNKVDHKVKVGAGQRLAKFSKLSVRSFALFFNNNNIK